MSRTVNMGGENRMVGLSLLLNLAFGVNIFPISFVKLEGEKVLKDSININAIFSSNHCTLLA